MQNIINELHNQIYLSVNKLINIYYNYIIATCVCDLSLLPEMQIALSLYIPYQITTYLISLYFYNIFHRFLLSIDIFILLIKFILFLTFNISQFILWKYDASLYYNKLESKNFQWYKVFSVLFILVSFFFSSLKPWNFFSNIFQLFGFSKNASNFFSVSVKKF
jgi:hypothetical protein